MKEEVCGTCKYHKHIYAHVRQMQNGIIKIDDGWVCINEDSINAGCYTEYEDKCDDWEEKS